MHQSKCDWLQKFSITIFFPMLPDYLIQLYTCLYWKITKQKLLTEIIISYRLKSHFILNICSFGTTLLNCIFNGVLQGVEVNFSEAALHPHKLCFCLQYQTSKCFVQVCRSCFKCTGGFTLLTYNVLSPVGSR